MGVVSSKERGGREEKQVRNCGRGGEVDDC